MPGRELTQQKQQDRYNSVQLSLFVAVSRGDLKSVEYLIDKYEYDINKALIVASDRTPLHLACLCGRTEVARWLIERGADINAKDGYGWTPLHCATCRKHIEIVEHLLDRGADTGIRGSEDGRTPLDIAIDHDEDDPKREQLIELFRRYRPELVLETWCTRPADPFV